MPSLIEEDPQYPAKVAAYLEKNNFLRMPWGYLLNGDHLVACSTVKERHERFNVGETAIVLLEGLGVSFEMLRRLMTEVPRNASPADAVAKLQELRAAQHG